MAVLYILALSAKRPSLDIRTLRRRQVLLSKVDPCTEIIQKCMQKYFSFVRVNRNVCFYTGPF